MSKIKAGDTLWTVCHSLGSPTQAFSGVNQYMEPRRLEVEKVGSKYFYFTSKEMVMKTELGTLVFQGISDARRYQATFQATECMKLCSYLTVRELSAEFTAEELVDIGEKLHRVLLNRRGSKFKPGALVTVSPSARDLKRYNDRVPEGFTGKVVELVAFTVYGTVYSVEDPQGRRYTIRSSYLEAATRGKR